MTTEHRRIRSILSLLKRFPATAAAGLAASSGLESLDDCAVIPVNSDIDLIVGSDFVRGEGFDLFKRGVLSWQDIGHYLIAANASDLAAMGGTPIGVVVVLRYSPQMSDCEYEQIMEGVLRACAEYQMPLLGGDSGGYEKSVLSATVLGTCPHGRALLRSGGQKGDLLYLTGEVGLAAAASAYFATARTIRLTFSTEEEQQLAAAWQRVSPALKVGELLVKRGLSRCGIDTSDGLNVACSQIAEASMLDVLLDPQHIPVAPLAVRVAEALELDPLAFGVGESVDFRLLFSSAADCAGDLRAEFENSGWPLYEIGVLKEPLKTPSVYLQTDVGLSPIPEVKWTPSYMTPLDAR